MSKIQKEVSKKNPYYISGERQMELEHFCRQYHEWWDKRSELLTEVSKPSLQEIKKTDPADPTYYKVTLTIKYRAFMEMVDKTIAATMQDEEFSSDKERDKTKTMLILNVTDGIPWRRTIDYICPRTRFYKLRRKFFWLLDKVRD